MSPFAIFAIMLTIAYIIYYGVNISRDLYGKKGRESETEEIFDMGTMSEIEEPIPVTEDGDSFIIGTQADLENLSESNHPGEQGREGKGSDDSYKGGTAYKSGTADKGGTDEKSEIAEKSKAEELVDNVRQNMLEGDIQSEVVMDETQFEDYLVNQQLILFDNQRLSKGLREVKAPDNGKPENNKSEIRDAI